MSSNIAYWGSHAEIEATIQELEKAQIVCPTHSPFNAPIWPVWKTKGTWRMTVDYHELNKVMPLLHAAVPSNHELRDRLTVQLGTYH